jgi:hypothetical protein
MDDDVEYVIPAAEVERIEDAHRRERMLASNAQAS